MMANESIGSYIEISRFYQVTIGICCQYVLYFISQYNVVNILHTYRDILTMKLT